MAREPIEVTRQDRIYCLKASSDYHSELCEECRFYPNCDHMTQDDMTELTIKDLETLEQEPKTGHWIYDNYNWRCSECNETPKTLGYVGTADFMTEHFKFCNHCGAKMIEPQESEDDK